MWQRTFRKDREVFDENAPENLLETIIQAGQLHSLTLHLWPLLLTPDRWQQKQEMFGRLTEIRLYKVVCPQIVKSFVTVVLPAARNLKIFSLKSSALVENAFRVGSSKDIGGWQMYSALSYTLEWIVIVIRL